MADGKGYSRHAVAFVSSRKPRREVRKSRLGSPKRAKTVNFYKKSFVNSKSMCNFAPHLCA